MAEENAKKPEEPELKKPLSLWEKFKTGTVSFVKSVLDYIPRGVLFSAAFVGIASLLAGPGGVGMLEAFSFNGLGFGGFLQRTAMVVGIGSIINGTLGAFKGIQAHTAFRNKEIELQERAIVKKRELERVQQQERHTETMAEAVAHGLPDEVSKTVTGAALGS